MLKATATNFAPNGVFELKDINQLRYPVRAAGERRVQVREVERRVCVCVCM